MPIENVLWKTCEELICHEEDVYAMNRCWEIE